MSVCLSVCLCVCVLCVCVCVCVHVLIESVNDGVCQFVAASASVQMSQRSLKKSQLLSAVI